MNNIVIVGGGAAGWLTAGVLAAEFLDTPVTVTLVESPDVSTIGVGEGTWPTMRSTLKTIGVSETDFLRRCSASFKQGSKFVGWRSGGPQDVYYHPFTLPAATSDTDMHAVWQAYYADRTFDRVGGMQPELCEQFKAPKTMAMPEYAGALNYGYHLDAGKFTEMLQEHCTGQLNVRHIKAHVEQVTSLPNGDIAAINTRDCGEVSGDLFIDCTGAQSLLIGEHFNIPFVDCSKFSINDRALAVQVPYAQADAPIASVTIGTAQSAGWTWDIGLQERRGVGYVYSCAHATDDEAWQHLSTHLSGSVSQQVIDELSPRALRFQAGHRETFWHRNCVAVGMSAGFIEPLEASALALVELSAAMIRDELPRTRSAMATVADRFNQVFRYRWQRIVEFLKLHYVLSERTDTDYWRDVKSSETMPDNLQALLELWQHRAPSMRDFNQVEELFPAASYAFVLYGLGYKTSCFNQGRRSAAVERGRSAVMEEDKKIQRHAAALPGNREFLTTLTSHRMSKV